MTKKKIAGTKNVYELAQERLKVIFNEFDNIYVSFSGGKDSGINLCGVRGKTAKRIYGFVPCRKRQ